MANLKTVSPSELYKMTGIPLKTLAGWRNKKVGPSYIKAEGEKGAIRYLISDVEEWMKRQKIQSGSDK